MKWLTKGRFIKYSVLLLVLVVVIVAALENYEWCKSNTICNYFYWNGFWRESFPLTLIGLSIITFPYAIVFNLISSAVFERWKKFAFRSVPVVTIITLLTLVYGKGGSMPGQFDAIYLVAPILYGWYFIHSFTIIIRAWRKEKTNNS